MARRNLLGFGFGGGGFGGPGGGGGGGGGDAFFVPTGGGGFGGGIGPGGTPFIDEGFGGGGFNQGGQGFGGGLAPQPFNEGPGGPGFGDGGFFNIPQTPPISGGYFTGRFGDPFGSENERFGRSTEADRVIRGQIEGIRGERELSRLDRLAAEKEKKDKETVLKVEKSKRKSDERLIEEATMRRDLVRANFLRRKQTRGGILSQIFSEVLGLGGGGGESSLRGRGKSRVGG